MQRVFRAGFLFSGLGAGARGFLASRASLGEDSARFVSLGGIDIDAEACADFELLTGSPAMVADVATMTSAALRAAWGDVSPDCVFASPPCKGFSALLPAKAATAPKYQALNRLVLQGIFLLCETWPDRPPATIVLENVPAITSRGAGFLRQVRDLLTGYGYRLHEGFHDCGEVGGLAQHRRRFLLIARHERTIPAFIYRPPKLRVRGCGEVLGDLPLPLDGHGAGPLHALPKINQITWQRLALIPPGGDWRDLPTGDRSGEIALGATAHNAACFKGRPGYMGVADWSQPARSVTGAASATSSNGVGAVADPRCTPQQFGISQWGCWHRPVTTLELAALQGMPTKIDGSALKLAGRATARWRERIGNAVPVGAATAIGDAILRALLAAELGTWTLGSTGIWVRADGRAEHEWTQEISAESDYGLRNP